MENYIVRIYRRDDEQNAIAGIVEIVGKQEERPFKTNEELLAILKSTKAGANIVWETIKKKNELRSIPMRCKFERRN